MRYLNDTANAIVREVQATHPYRLMNYGEGDYETIEELLDDIKSWNIDLVANGEKPIDPVDCGEYVVNANADRQDGSAYCVAVRLDEDGITMAPEFYDNR